MLKRISWRKVLYGFLWIISLGAIGTLMGFIEMKKTNMICKDVRVLLPGNQTFIERSEIDKILFRSAGPLIGRPLNEVNIHKLEKGLASNPFIEFSKVYADMDGVIQVEVKQREPVIRIINIANQDFYIDRNGLKFPTSASFTAHVLVANGEISESFRGRVDTLRGKLAKDLFKTALFVSNHKLWRDQIEQIYVNTDEELELVPRVGNQRIILGTADSLDAKFTNLLVFYKKGMPQVGWDAYKTINLKYTNQIVCVKNTDSTTMETMRPVAAVDSTSKNKITQDTIKIN
jgi:cell division protein FtsQ